MAAAGQRQYLSLLGRDVALYGALSAIARMSGLLALPFLTRALSTTDYGVVELMLSSVTVLSLIFSLSFESALARLWNDVETVGDRNDLIVSITGSAISSGLILSLLGLGVAAFFSVTGRFGMALSDLIIVLASSTMVAAGAVLSTALRMERKIISYNFFFFISALTFLVISYVALYIYHQGRAGIAFAILTSNLLAFAYIVLLRREAFRGRFRLQFVRSALHISLPILPSVILFWITRQFDKFILASIVDLKAVALYGAVEKLSFIVSFAVSVFQQAWLPIALGKFDDPNTRNAFFAKVILFYAMGAIVLAASLFAFSQEIWTLVVPPAYAGGLSLLPWIVGSAIAYAAGSISGIGLIIAKQTSGNLMASVTACLLNGIGSFALVSFIGLGGAGVSSFFASLIYASILGFYSFRLANLRFPYERLAAIVALYAVVSIVIFGLPGDHSHQMPPLEFRLMASGFLAVCVPVIGFGFRGLRQSFRELLPLWK